MIKKSVEDDRRSVGVPPAVAGTSRPRFGEITIRDRGRLPHWEKDSATYFITFRWSDSLPNALLAKIESERKSIVDNANQIGRELSPDERKRLQNLSPSRIENDLDTGAGACYLFDDIRYRLLRHAEPCARGSPFVPRAALASIIHSWKSCSAKEVGRILRRQGTFWQREYYDHLIRNENELQGALRYVAENPVKAGLVNWGWVWVWGQDAPTTPAGRRRY